MARLTHEEMGDLLDRIIEANEAGDTELAIKLSQQKPMSPWLAKGVKDIFGKEYLEGWDLSDAEAEYGKDWLNR